MLVQGVSDSSFDVIGDEFDDGGGYGGLVQFVNEGVNVDGVEGFAKVKGYNNGASWGLILVKALGDLVVDLWRAVVVECLALKPCWCSRTGMFEVMKGSTVFPGFW